MAAFFWAAWRMHAALVPATGTLQRRLLPTGNGFCKHCLYGVTFYAVLWQNTKRRWRFISRISWRRVTQATHAVRVTSHLFASIMVRYMPFPNAVLL